MSLSALRELPLLAPLSDADLDLLRGQCAWSWYQPGGVVARQGQASGEFCILARGQVELRRSMGVDVVVAVDVTQYGFTAGAPLPEATTRAFDIMVRQTITASLEWADVGIRPELSGLNGFSFESAPEYVRRGYAAGRDGRAGDPLPARCDPPGVCKVGGGLCRACRLAFPDALLAVPTGAGAPATNY